ncbi:helix-turn-helix domain-containing protein [Halovulum sp. GXIMD14793]
MLFALHNIGEDDPLDSYFQPMFQALAAEAWRLACTPSPTSMPEPRTDLVRKALDLTLGSLESNLTMDELASVLATTPRTLSRRFMDELGMPWRAARQRLRMIRALETMAQDTAPVTEIALDIGYTSTSAFNTAFCQFTGQTPTQFRASLRR